MSVLDRQAIPRDFLTYYVEHQPNPELKGKMQLIKALGVLKAFSFVVEDKDHSLDTHRLVVTQKWLVRRSTICHFSGQALLAMTHHYPFGDLKNLVGYKKYPLHVYAVLKFEETGSRDKMVAKGSLLHCTAGSLVLRRSYRHRWWGYEAICWAQSIPRR
jgi:hypothetical protein